MFNVNDCIIYGRTGVCKIDDITTLNFDDIDKEKKYYILQPLYSQSSKIYIPVNNNKVIMRKIVSEKEAKELIDSIPNIDIIWFDNEKLRDEAYKKSMYKCECKEWIRIIKSLYLRRKERQAESKKLSIVDERYMRSAEDLLYGELAIALNMSKEDVESFITKLVETNKTSTF